MRPLHHFDSARYANELNAQAIVKRFRAFSELPFNLFGSEEVRTEISDQYNFRLCSDVSSAPEVIYETENTLEVRFGFCKDKGLKAATADNALDTGKNVMILSHHQDGQGHRGVQIPLNTIHLR